MTPLPDPNSPQVKALVDFLITFIKALQQTSYYTGDHPAAHKAREGLFALLGRCLGDKPEVSFIRRHYGGQTIIVVDGLFAEPVDIHQLVRSEENRLFLPKLAEYFARRNLFSFTLKKVITAEEFHRFINMMSESPQLHPQGAGDLSGMARQLQCEGITSISVILDQESIGRGLQLPWRVEIALSRLHKDLQVLPLFQKASPEKLRQIKREVVSDVLRPIRQPEAVRDILCYQDLITAGDPQLKGLELQEDLLHAFTPGTVILAVDLGLPANLHPQFDRQKIEGRFKLSLQQAVRGELEPNRTLDEALKRCLERGWLNESQIPPAIRRRAESQRLADEYLKHPGDWAETLGQQIQRNPGSESLRRLVGALAGLIEQENFSQLSPLLQVYTRHKSALAALPPAASETEYALLKRRDLWEAIARDLPGLEEPQRQEREALVTTFPAPFSAFIREQVLQESEEVGYRFLCELLPHLPDLEIGLYDTLLSRHREDPHYLIPAVLSLSRTHLPQAGERIVPLLRHKRRSVRRESLGALFRLGREKYREGAVQLLEDPDPTVKTAAIRFLSGLGSREAALLRKYLRFFLDIDDLPLRLAVLEALARLGPQAAQELRELEPALLQFLKGLVPKSTGFFRRRLDWLPELCLPLLHTLGTIGGQASAAWLRTVADQPPQPWQAAVKKARESIDRRCGKPA